MNNSLDTSREREGDKSILDLFSRSSALYSVQTMRVFIMTRSSRHRFIHAVYVYVSAALRLRRFLLSFSHSR